VAGHFHGRSIHTGVAAAAGFSDADIGRGNTRFEAGGRPHPVRTLSVQPGVAVESAADDAGRTIVEANALPVNTSEATTRRTSAFIDKYATYFPRFPARGEDQSHELAAWYKYIVILPA
jgi:hypothetical protein